MSYLAANHFSSVGEIWLKLTLIKKLQIIITFSLKIPEIKKIVVLANMYSSCTTSKQQAPTSDKSKPGKGQRRASHRQQMTC